MNESQSIRLALKNIDFEQMTLDETADTVRWLLSLLAIAAVRNPTPPSSQSPKRWDRVVIDRPYSLFHGKTGTVRANLRGLDSVLVNIDGHSVDNLLPFPIAQVAIIRQED